jgi:methylated-DNA-[protein]-cysteine S-methyltransferase
MNPTPPRAAGATLSSTRTLQQAFRGVPLQAQARLDSPVGPLLALATARGVAGLWFDDPQRDATGLDVPASPRHAAIDALRRWLDAYWSGKPTPADAVPLDLHGTPFQRSVWQVLLRIPFGHTRSYGQVAADVGAGAVPRATGTAVGRNPVSILVPCHRVLGADGSLTGYAGGLPRKQRLLVHEGVLLA